MEGRRAHRGETPFFTTNLGAHSVPVQQKGCSMSHHFDTPTAREDPRICVNDFYLFDGAAGTTVMAMTVNADAGLSAPDTFREEGLYAFRFDLNGDAREELTFKFTVNRCQFILLPFKRTDTECRKDVPGDGLIYLRLEQSSNPRKLANEALTSQGVLVFLHPRSGDARISRQAPIRRRGPRAACGNNPSSYRGAWRSASRGGGAPGSSRRPCRA